MDLPTETLYAIFHHLQPHPGHLAQVVRVCRRFRAIAEHILYAHIFIQESLPQNSPFPHRVQRWCETILARRDIHDVVRRLTIRWQTDVSVRDQYEPFVQPVLLTLNRALRGLTQLEALDLAFDLVGVPISVDTVLGGLHFPGLRVFALYGIGPGSLPVKYGSDTLALQRFLSATPSLEHLMLGDHFHPLELAHDDLPLLTGFRGTATAAASIIPRRIVHHLALVGQDQFAQSTLAELARGRMPVRTLDLSAVSITPTTLKDVSHHLTCVEHLKVRFAFRHTLHTLNHTFMGISILAGLAPVFSALPVLRLLDLSATPAPTGGFGTSLEEVNLCQTWGRSCPSLRTVVFPSKTEWTLSGPEHIWVSKSPPRYTRS